MTLRDLGLVRSDRCGLDELILAYDVDQAGQAGLSLSPDWARRWTAAWRRSAGEVVCPVRDLGPVPVSGCEPVRRFSWRARQRHRPGLEFLTSTGRLHGFESLEERSLLLALDFVGVAEVLPQPFRLRFELVGGGFREHIPDFLVVFPGGKRWLFDVRPAHLVKERDEACFAAAGEAALAAGWRYSVVAGWRHYVLGVLDALSAQRRPLEDQLGLQDRMLEVASGGSVMFGDLVDATSLPVVARAHVLHLLWHRRLGVDLSHPLVDRSPVWLAERAG